MKTYKVILRNPKGDDLLFTTDSLMQAKKVFDKIASTRGVKKDESLHLNKTTKIKSIYKFNY